MPGKVLIGWATAGLQNDQRLLFIRVERGRFEAEAAVCYVGWMTLFSSTIAIAERWTGRAA